MVFDVLLISVTIIALSIASFSDIKRREVPDWLSYGLIFVALGLRTIFSFQLGWTILLNGIIGFIFCLGFAYLFYYTGQWGGGDSKLLMAMGAIIGISYPFQSSSLNLLWFFLALLFLGAIYGVVWMFFTALKRRKIFWPQFVKALRNYNKMHLLLGIITIIFIAATFWKSFLWPLIAFPLGLFYLFLFVAVVEESCFFKMVSVTDLTEGDWLARSVVADKKIVLKKKTLTESDLELLEKLRKSGKVRKVLLKEGIPFIPSFLLAYLLLTFGKPLIMFVLEKSFF